MFNIFKAKPPNISIQGLGEFKYFKDKADEYWELISKYRDPENSIDIDFCALLGTPNEVGLSAKNIAIELLNNPSKIWKFADDEFLNCASEDISDVTKNSIKEYFYIKTFTAENSDSFEIGFHAYNSDVFIELFVRGGEISNIEKDYGCCDV